MIRTCVTTLAAAVVAIGLAACGPGAPTGRKTAQAMPDTSVPMDNPPDAAATGLVPKEGVAPTQPTPTQAMPNEPDVPVDVPAVQPK